MRQTVWKFGLSMAFILTAIGWIGVVVFCRNDAKFCGGCCEPGIVIAALWLVFAPLCVIAALVGTLVADRTHWMRLFPLYGAVIAGLATLTLLIDWSGLLVGLGYVLSSSIFFIVARRHRDLRKVD